MLTRLILVYSEGPLACELQMIYVIRELYLEVIKDIKHALTAKENLILKRQKILISVSPKTYEWLVST